MIAVCIIFFCLVAITYMGLRQENLPLGLIALNGLISIATTTLAFYFGGSIMDSTNVVGAVASAVAKKDEKTDASGTN